jgi:hypothetical protein
MGIISKRQIIQIDAFVRKHGIKYYDVRSEIIDHLASDIERMTIEQPELNYEQARYRALLNLPETEFRNIQKEKELYLKSYWKSTITNELLEYFQLPKILMTIAFFLVIFFISALYSFTPQILMAIGTMFLMAQVLSVQEKFNWLILKTFTDYVSGSIFLCQCIILWVVNNIPESNTFWNETHSGNALMTTITVLFLLADYLCGVHIPNRLLKDLREQYPETYLAI